MRISQARKEERTLQACEAPCGDVEACTCTEAQTVGRWRVCNVRTGQLDREEAGQVG